MRIRVLMSACAMTLLITVTTGAASRWETNYEQAVNDAKAEGKYVLLDFSGSDWCGWCMKLEDEVFSKKAFKTYAEERLVCTLIDFPRRTRMKKSLVEQNEALARKYEVRGYPTVLLLSPDETLVGRTGYREGGPDAYVKHLQEMVAAYEAKHGPPKATVTAADETRTTAANARVEPDDSRDSRRWTSITGTTVEASLYETKGVYAVLLNGSGEKVTIPIARLSRDDRAYIESLKGGSGAN